MSKKTVTFSFVIAAYNAAEHLRKNLASMKELSYDKSLFEVVVVDDGSTDNTESVINKVKRLNIVYIRGERHGAPYARNVGIRHSKNNIIVFLDSDVILQKDILRIYAKDFERKDIDAVQGNVWEQMINTPLTAIHSKWRQSAFLDKVWLENGLIKTLDTRNVAVRKSILDKFEKSGNYLFNERMTTTNGEDRELGYRLVEFGAKILLDDKAIVYHKDPTTHLKIFMQKYRHAKGDAKLGISERLYDISNFNRAVIRPTRLGVPLYFSFLAWAFHVCGSELEIAKMNFSKSRQHLKPKF